MWALVALAVVKGVSSFMSSRAKSKEYAGQAAVSDYRARLAELDADAQARATDFAGVQHVLESGRILGDIRVEQGASGARTDVGGPFRVRNQQNAFLEADRALLGMAGRSRESALRSESTLARRQAKLFRKGSRNAFISGFLGAGVAGLETFAGLQTGGFVGAGDRTVIGGRPSTTRTRSFASTSKSSSSKSHQLGR